MCAAAARNSAESVEKKGLLKVMLVEDSPSVRERLRVLMADLGHLEVVAECDNAAMAIGLLQSHPVDLMVLDIKLRGSHGMDVLRNVKSQNPHIKVVVFTNHSESEFRTRFLASGADRFFNKGDGPEELREYLLSLASAEKSN